MILRNKKGLERNFRLLLEIDNKNKRYIVYEDINTLNIYGGKIIDDTLKPLDEDEYIFINNIIGKISG